VRRPACAPQAGVAREFNGPRLGPGAVARRCKGARAELSAHRGAQVPVSLFHERCELGRDVVADLEAARADARADGREIERAELERAPDDVRDDAAPAGVHSGDRAGLRIREQDGHAVGDANGQHDIGCPRDGTVGTTPAIIGRSRRSIDGNDIGAMRLIEPYGR